MKAKKNIKIIKTDHATLIIWGKRDTELFLNKSNVVYSFKTPQKGIQELIRISA